MRIARMLLVLLVTLMGFFILPARANRNSDVIATLAIPMLGMYADVVPVYVETLAYGTTWNFEDIQGKVGFFDGLPWFGQDNNVVLGGHSRTRKGSPDIFYRLNDLSTGDKITVETATLSLQYRIADIRHVDVQDVSVLTSASKEQLTLITCDLASHNRFTGGYDQRLVVVAKPSLPSRQAR